MLHTNVINIKEKKLSILEAENFIKIVNSSAFCSNDNIISDNYKITNNEKIGIIPPIGGG